MDLGRKISINVTKHLISQKNPKYDGYQHGLASMLYKFLTKNLGCSVKNESISN